MTTRKINLNKEIVALFSGQANVLTTPKLYVQLTKNHSLAIVLNQCVYWSNKSRLDHGWFYKTYEEWFDEICMPARTLRRRFQKLHEKGWIETKIKKINGINTHHIKVNIDLIIDSISNILDLECPNRPDVQSSSEIIQNNCIKSVPIGHIGRSESAKMTDSSICTEDYNQKKLTTVPDLPPDLARDLISETSSSSFFSEKQNDELLSYKLPSDERTPQLFLEHCKFHAEKQINDLSKFQRFTGLKHILIKLYESQDKFIATGFNKKQEMKILEKRVVTKEDFDNYKKCISGYDWVRPAMQRQA